MPMQIGDQIILIAEFKDYKVGTKGYLGGWAIDSGTTVPIFILKDDNTQLSILPEEDRKEFLGKYRTSMDVIAYFNTILPYEECVSSREKLLLRINENNLKIEELEKQSDELRFYNNAYFAQTWSDYED